MCLSTLDKPITITSKPATREEGSTTISSSADEHLQK